LISFRAEAWSEVKSEVTAHWPEHYSEVYSDDDYAPDFDRYDAVDASGGMLIVTARRDGELIGYVVAFVNNHLHQKDTIWGFIDSYWLKREARAPRVFHRMIAAVESEMKVRGVSKVHATERSDGRSFAWMGWRAAERSYIKEL